MKCWFHYALIVLAVNTYSSLALAQDKTVTGQESTTSETSGSLNNKTPKPVRGQASSTAVNTGQRTGPALGQRMQTATESSAAGEQERGRSDYVRPYYEQTEGKSILEKERPDLEPEAVRYKSFKISPSVLLGWHYNDNIFSTEKQTIGDYIFSANPGVKVESDWRRHELNLEAAARSAAYGLNPRQDFTDVIVQANGAYDIQEGEYLSGGLSYQNLHEERGFPNTDNLTREVGPTEYGLLVANTGFTRKMGKVGFTLGYDFLNWNYRNNGPIFQDDRDRRDNVGTFKIGYEFIRGYEIFTRLRVNDRDYNLSRDKYGWKRDSDGYEGDIGASFNLTNLLSGDIYVGYANQDYKDSRFDTVSEPVFGSSLLWTVTDLTSIRLLGSRTVEDSVLDRTSSYVQSALKVEFEHELMRNLLLASYLEYRNYDYFGVDISRKDDLYEGSFGGKYLISRNIALGAEYIYRRRDSNVALSDYTQNNVLASISFRY